jgi:protein-disulfide isomerase
MRRVPLLACLLTLIPLFGWPGVARAADPAAFTPAQRQQIIQIVRDALKNDPSILREAVESLQADQQAREAADSRARLESHRQVLVSHAGDPVVGNPQGDVTLVEFYDPRCPYCRRMLPSIADLLKTDAKIRLVYKDIPVLGPASEMETRAILAAQNQGGYEKMQRALMTNPAQPDVAMIRATAAHLGLDAERLLSDMYAAPVTAKIQANLALARELKVDGTPVWVIGETLITGAVDEAALAEAVTAARGKKG